MKKTIISLVAVFIFMIGNAQNKVSLKGKIKKSETRKVWIYNYDKTISDTVKLNFFRKFKYSNSFKEDELCFIVPLESSIPLVFSVNSVSVIKFKTKLPDIHLSLSMKGKRETSKASEFFNEMSQYQFMIQEVEKKLYAEETADGQYHYDSLLTTIQADLFYCKKEFIKDNKNQSTLLMMNRVIDYENEHELVQELEKGLRKNYSNTAMYKKVSAEIRKYNVFQEKLGESGDKAPMIILPDVDGEDYSLENLTGNYILIDFWASWCAPCRAGHPNLVKLYKQYNSLGFEIYSVSLDKTKEKWIKAIAKDQLLWSSHVSSLNGFNCPTVTMYDIKALPFNVLINRDGVVEGVNLKGKKLEEKLKQVFDENK